MESAKNNQDQTGSTTQSDQATVLQRFIKQRRSWAYVAPICLRNAGSCHGNILDKIFMFYIPAVTTRCQGTLAPATVPSNYRGRQGLTELHIPGYLIYVDVAGEKE